MSKPLRAYVDQNVTTPSRGRMTADELRATLSEVDLTKFTRTDFKQGVHFEGPHRQRIVIEMPNLHFLDANLFMHEAGLR